MSLHLAKSKVCQDRWLLKSEYHVRSCQIRNMEANFFLQIKKINHSKRVTMGHNSSIILIQVF